MNHPEPVHPEAVHPELIQGGMGANISTWLLAKSVAVAGHLGVVSGTALDMVLARRLQLGDPGGHLQRALSHFPAPEVARRILEKYYIPGGKKTDEPFRPVPMFTANPSVDLLELTVAGNFVEVFLAKEGHGGPIGINYLEKIQLPNLSSIYGAMLAGVDYVLVGAGIPREIPGILDTLVAHGEVSMALDVQGSEPEDDFRAHFDPRVIAGGVTQNGGELKRPKFLAIVASAVLALTLAKKSTGTVDGFVIELPVAGGHNASPRGQLKLNERGEPIYGPKDEVDLKKIKEIGLPFWLAGDYGTSEGFKEAKAQGAVGIQAGTAFAFCIESGLDPGLRQSLVKKAVAGEADVFTDPLASPTSFPFKVARLDGTNSEAAVYEARKRVCDLGYLRHLYKKEDGAIGYRCPSEPEDQYVKKGGLKEDTIGRKCLCNSLMANIGLAQVRKNGYVEKPLVTAGCDLVNTRRFLSEGKDSYSAEDAIRVITG